MGEKNDLDFFIERINKYSDYFYDKEFNGFWNWKVAIENNNGHIFDDSFRKETHNRISRILPGWQTYRPSDSEKCLAILEDAMPKLSDAYSEIKNYTLLEFSEIPEDSLKVIWDELGRCKEDNGRINTNGYYYVVAITKPLMFFWGQTLSFDNLVRDTISKFFNVNGINDNKWNFDKWKRIMENFQVLLNSHPEIIDSIKEFSEDKYGSNSQVPYGRFLDMYYWIKGKGC